MSYHCECFHTSINLLLKVTDPYGNTIDDLQISGFNIDVPDEYTEDFTYSFKQNELDEYRLEQIIDVNEYRQPPPPPGYWEIMIEDSENEYVPYTISPTPEILAGQEFYKNIELAKNHPYIFEKYPWDEANGIELNPTLYVEVSDHQNDNLQNVTFYEWYNGEWTLIKEYEDINDESGIFSAQPSHMNEPWRTYRWKVEAYDEFGNFEEREFSFST
jgi:hypothetical protein